MFLQPRELVEMGREERQTALGECKLFCDGPCETEAIVAGLVRAELREGGGVSVSELLLSRGETWECGMCIGERGGGRRRESREQKGLASVENNCGRH